MRLVTHNNLGQFSLIFSLRYLLRILLLLGWLLLAIVWQSIVDLRGVIDLFRLLSRRITPLLDLGSHCSI